MSLARLFATISLLTAVPLLAQAVPQRPMARDAHPSYAVVTVKPHDPNSNRGGFHAEGNRYIVLGRSVAALMQFAYELSPHQIVSAPDWAYKARYDIEGTMDSPGEPSVAQQREILQKLLAERFKLHFVREKRNLPVYAITIAKGGPKLNPAANPAAEPDQDAEVHGPEITQIYTSAALSDFIMGMQFFITDRPFIDLTGLTGRYDIRLTYTSGTSTSTDANVAPVIFTAVQEQLGLKFQPTKADIDVFVIDHVDRPSEN